LEQSVISERPAQARSSGNSAFPGKELAYSQAGLITEDPATFLVAHHILLSGVTSLSSVKAYFARSPEILEIVDDLLLKMEKADLIAVQGDALTVKQRLADIGGNIEDLRRFLPRLFRIAAERVLKDAGDGSHKAKRESIRYFALSDDKATAIEAQAIYLEFRTKMLGLIEKGLREERKGSGVRVVGVFNSTLVPEDFV
jgi:hypothetical protein